MSLPLITYLNDDVLGRYARWINYGDHLRTPDFSRTSALFVLDLYILGSRFYAICKTNKKKCRVEHVHDSQLRA